MKQFEPVDAHTAAAWAGAGGVLGDGSAVVDNASALSEAVETSVCFIRENRPSDVPCRVGLLIGPADTSLDMFPGENRPKALLPVDRPEAVFAAILSTAFPLESPEPGIHDTSIMDPSAETGGGVSVGPCCVVEAGAVLGEGVVLGAFCFVGRNSRIGPRSVLWPRVTVYHDVRIGSRCIVHSGTVIGSDGFGFTEGEEGVVKVPQLGTVEIEDDVEVGSNCTIDRGTLGPTVIRKMAKIDNLVHIAHNVEVGEGTMMAAQSGIAGSTRVGRGVLIGGQAGITGHVEVGDGAKISAQAGVSGSLKPGAEVTGFPARPRRLFMRMMALLERAARQGKQDKGPFG